MKIGQKIGVSLLLLIMLACGGKSDNNTTKTTKSKIENPRNLPSSGGKTLEMILVMPDAYYKDDIKDSIGTYFLKACDGISNPEPLFDLVQMPPKNFYNSEMFQKHRNILIVDFNSQNDNTIYKRYDYKSYPQAYFEISVRDKQALFEILQKYSNVVINKYYDNEHRRVYNAFKRLENIEITRKLKHSFGFSLNMSNEFSISIFEDDFAWFRKDYFAHKHQRTLNIMVHKTAYIGEGMFKEEKIIELRDKIAKENIPGPTRGSYMGTESRFPLVRKEIMMDSLRVVETRGLWRLFNDFMGGSFINYVFYNPNTDEFVMIDCFLYAPNQNKRDELMQLESIVYSIKFY